MSSSRPTAIRVLRLRVKDKHASWLSGLAREVNTVFNYCNELSVKVFERERRFLSGFDFWPFLKGVTRGDCALHLPVQAVQEIAEEHARRRRQHQKIRHRSRAIHAKIANRRKDFLHKLSTDLVKANGAIFVGNVNASALAKTRLAKSVLDAGWSAFRTMLLCKCADAGVWFDEVDEAFSTQTCSVCNSRAGPKGRKDLGIRGWQCTVCGAVHDRNVNAAHNILAAGHRRLAEEILVP